ncbi:hypothetical protein M5689_013352 [Euphorbia peplus]|nr:hypothetical protein M5689_013352 [Euphorbia peplus]
MKSTVHRDSSSLRRRRRSVSPSSSSSYGDLGVSTISVEGDVQGAFRMNDKNEIVLKIQFIKSSNFVFCDELDSYLEKLWEEIDELKKKLNEKNALVKKLKRRLEPFETLG